MKNIAVLASGSGSNFEAIVKAGKRGLFKARIKLLVTDNQKAFARQRARKYKIKDIFIDRKKFRSCLSFDQAIVKLLRAERVELVVLAGYMRILTPYFVKAFKNKILNIHPALLPAFKGTQAIQRAFNYGSKVTGVTVHFLDEQVDHGPIILQQALTIKPGMKVGQLEAQIHKLEHKLYPQAIKLFLENKLRVKKRHVTIL